MLKKDLSIELMQSVLDIELYTEAVAVTGECYEAGTVRDGVSFRESSNIGCVSNRYLRLADVEVFNNLHVQSFRLSPGPR